MGFVSVEDRQPATPPNTERAQYRRRSITRKQPGQFPRHPIPQLQGPFEESILEAGEEDGDKWVVDIDAQSRRRDLLGNAGYERLCGRKWRQRPSERYHPFWKLASNISFGVYLLAKGLAKSDAGVLRILQRYVDELDEFIERSMEDFLIIQIDVRTRMQYLGLPLANLDIFDEMLDDRSFRLAMIDYNEKIEYAIGRFAVAIKDSINDIQKGKEAVGALWHYIGRLEREDNSSGNLNAICGAMLANIEGWNAAFRKLNKKGISLDSALVKLGMAVVEMQRRVGVASRRSVVRHKIIDQYNCSDVSSNVKQMPFSKPPNVPSQGKPTPKWNERERPTTVFGFGESDKPLPRDPDLLEAVRRSPATGESRSRRIMTKSVPNLRNANKSHYHDEEAKGLANKKSRAESGGDRAPSKPQRSFSKAILKSTHAKEFVGRGTEETQSRPATAPARTTLKSRSISLDHLKTLCALRKTHQETLSRSSISPARQVATPAVTRRDILKNQVLHYVRSDKVDEAWEASVNGEKKTSRRPLQKKLDWPLSIFRARSSTNRHVGETRRSAVLTNGLGGKMTWLEEDPGALNTYSLKPKRDESPRIPVPSPQLTPAESEEEVNGEEAETGSLITALPSMSHPLMNGQAPDAGHGQATENIAQPLGLVS